MSLYYALWSDTLHGFHPPHLLPRRMMSHIGFPDIIFKSDSKYKARYLISRINKKCKDIDREDFLAKGIFKELIM